MNRARLLVLPLLLGLACSPGLRRPSGGPGVDATMGVYRATVERAEGTSRRFRLLLYASPPDRLHGEVVSPVGQVVLIVDGGGGVLAVTFPREREAFRGPASADAMEKLIGVPLSLEDLVAGLLEGRPPSDGVQLSREPSTRVGLPKRVVLSDPRGRLTLELRRTAPLKTSTDEFGTGRAPGGMRERPLAELGAVDLPGATVESPTP